MIQESDEVAPDVIADFDQAGAVVSIEVTRTSRIVRDAEHVVFERSN